MEIKKLIIHYNDDMSVGIFPQTWEVDVPFYISDSTQMDDVDKEDLERFRKEMSDIYSEYADGRVWAQYDFELKAENDMMDEIYREAENRFPDTLTNLED